MENVRIAILNSENKVVAYMDNTAPNAMQYYACRKDGIYGFC